MTLQDQARQQSLRLRDAKKRITSEVAQDTAKLLEGLALEIDRLQRLVTDFQDATGFESPDDEF